MILIWDTGENIIALRGCWVKETLRSNLSLFYFMKKILSSYWIQHCMLSVELVFLWRFIWSSFFSFFSSFWQNHWIVLHYGFSCRQQSMNENTLDTIAHNMYAKYLMNEFAMNILTITFRLHFIILFTRIVSRHL